MNLASKAIARSGVSKQSQTENKSVEETVKEDICAIVVTYNRKALLLGCLESLLEQICPLDAIYLVDNASVDGTPELLQAKGYIQAVLCPNGLPLESEYTIRMQSKGNQDKQVKIHYVRMHENSGGAGGFYEGIKRSYERGYDWLWLMDDDVQLSPTTLSELMKFKKFLESRNEDYSFLCSKVVGKTGASVNVPTIDNRYYDDGYPKWSSYIEHGSIKILRNTFVSIIINRKDVFEKGLPYKEFFLWGEDFEYTLRLSQKKPGYLVGKSIAIHLRETETILRISNENDINRIRNFDHYFRNRNYTFYKYYGLKFTIGFMTKEIILELYRILKRGDPYRFLKIKIIIRGTLLWVFFHPRVAFLSNMK